MALGGSSLALCRKREHSVRISWHGHQRALGERQRRVSQLPEDSGSVIVWSLVRFPFVLVISAESLVLLKNDVKILKLAAGPGPEIANSGTASCVPGTVQPLPPAQMGGRFTALSC